MILIPAWVIVVLTAMVAVDNLVRFRQERNLLLLGKVLAWGLASAVYLLIALDVLSIMDARAASRWAWVVVPSTELAYRYARSRWKV